MLTAYQIEALRQRSERLLDPVTNFLIMDIAKRVSEAGQLTGTASYLVWRAQNLGISQRKLKKELQKLLKVSQKEVEQLLTQAAETGYNFDISRFPTTHAIPFSANSNLQQILEATVKLAQKDLTNITQTMGFVGSDGVCRELTQAYQQACDFAFQKVSTGAQDYISAVREATKNLVEKGIRTIDYESGVHTSVEAATRRNIMGGLGLMQEQISEKNHDDLGCNGWEISAHAASAPDHEPIQGKQYSDEEYTRLNNSLVRRIGTLNCGHAAFPIILGVNLPQYTDEDLEKFRKDNEDGVEFDGKHYTMYEATQRQRKFERTIRKQKQRILADEALGDKDKLQNDQIHLVRLQDEYRRFSKGTGLRTQHARMEMSGFGPKQAKAAEKVPSNSKIAAPKKKQVRTKGSAGLTHSPAAKWDSSIGTQSWNESVRKAMHDDEQGTIGKKHEVARVYDGEGRPLFKVRGDSGSVTFTSCEIKKMRGGVLTHNHPSESCFSPEDINMLRQGELLEMRAVVSRGVYRLQKPAKWSREISSLEKIDAAYYDIDSVVSPPILAKAWSGELTFAQADAMCQEAVIREFANRYGMGFEFDLWDEIRSGIK